MFLRIANFEGDRNGREKRVRTIDRDVEHQPVNAGHGFFSEIENAPVHVSDAAASVAPAVPGDENVEFDGNARSWLTGYCIQNVRGDHHNVLRTNFPQSKGIHGDLIAAAGDVTLRTPSLRGTNSPMSDFGFVPI